MLVMKNALMYRIGIVKDKNKECKNKISMIPGRLAKYLQTLDVSISKLFKVSWRRGALSIA